jgi:Ca-activated chloride channel family protein
MSKSIPQIEFLTERPTLAAGRDQTVNLLITITAPAAGPSTLHRPDLNLGMVLDRSGSMKGPKIERAIDAAGYCIDQLLPSDRISVVIFDDVVDTLIPSQLAEDKSELKRKLERIQPRNSTALHEAWVRGGIQVSEHLNEKALNRVLLITDGQANCGLTDTDQIVSQALGLAQRGVSTSTIGIGAGFNEDLLMPMARSGGGNAWRVEHPDDTQRIFTAELEGLIAEVAHSVSLGLIPSDGIRLTDLLNDFDIGGTGRYKLPNLQADSPLEVVVQLRIPAQPPGARLRLLDLRLGHTPSDSKQAEVVKRAFEVEFETETGPENPDVAKAVRLLMNARARREAVSRMDAGDYTGARRTIATALSATYAACAQSGALGSPQGQVRIEIGQLEELSVGLADPSQGNVNRKRLTYQAYLLSESKRSG